jgi:hypothetical protein
LLERVGVRPYFRKLVWLCDEGKPWNQKGIIERSGEEAVGTDRGADDSERSDDER